VVGGLDISHQNLEIHIQQSQIIMPLPLERRDSEHGSKLNAKRNVYHTNMFLNLCPSQNLLPPPFILIPEYG